MRLMEMRKWQWPVEDENILEAASLMGKTDDPIVLFHAPALRLLMEGDQRAAPKGFLRIPHALRICNWLTNEIENTLQGKS